MRVVIGLAAALLGLGLVLFPGEDAAPGGSSMRRFETGAPPAVERSASGRGEAPPERPNRTAVRPERRLEPSAAALDTPEPWRLTGSASDALVAVAVAPCATTWDDLQWSPGDPLPDPIATVQADTQGHFSFTFDGAEPRPLERFVLTTFRHGRLAGFECRTWTEERTLDVGSIARLGPHRVELLSTVALGPGARLRVARRQRMCQDVEWVAADGRWVAEFDALAGSLDAFVVDEDSGLCVALGELGERGGTYELHPHQLETVERPPQAGILQVRSRGRVVVARFLTGANAPAESLLFGAVRARAAGAIDLAWQPGGSSLKIGELADATRTGCYRPGRGVEWLTSAPIPRGR